MLSLILLSSVLIFYIAYRYYGNFLSKKCALDDSRATPALAHEDGVDYAPARASVLFGHHFSSIAGAGPIVGPILAATYFGWGPTWAWILIGAIFVGGVHDFGSAFMSLRNQGLMWTLWLIYLSLLNLCDHCFFDNTLPLSQKLPQSSLSWHPV